MMRVFFSTMAAASLTRCRRSVSNRARRHGERFGQAARRVHQIQQAQPCSSEPGPWPRWGRVSPANAHLIGLRLGAGGAVRGKMRLPGLDVVFGLPTGGIELFVEMLAAHAVQIGHDVPGITPPRTDLDTRDHAPGFWPGTGGIGKGLEPPDLLAAIADIVRFGKYLRHKVSPMSREREARQGIGDSRFPETL